MRDKYNIKISVPSGEGANALIRGSLILGPKIGQGFYQNLRGNFNELTADQWWMRMWNRMVGNPFKPPPTKEVMQERRTKLRELIRAPEGPVEKQSFNRRLTALACALLIFAPTRTLTNSLLRLGLGGTLISETSRKQKKETLTNLSFSSLLTPMLMA
jgi:hypothetical protein